MPALASTTPVTPPMVNRKMKPIAHSIGVRNSIEPPHMVAIQERSEEHTSELQSPCNLVCRLLLEKKIEHLTLRVLSKYADLWHFPGGPPDDLRHNSAILGSLCAAIRSDPSSIVWTVLLL